MAFDTAGSIINDVAVEVGLAAVADPYASTDPNFIQLRGLLKRVGRKLVNAKQWTHLQRTAVITTTLNQSTYALPADFLAMIAQSGWNRTNRLPLGGPLSPQEWQYLKGRNTGIVFSVLFRPQQGFLTLYPDTATPAGQVIAFEYISRFWALGLTGTRGAWLRGAAYSVGDIVANSNGYYICVVAGTSPGIQSNQGPTGIGAGIQDGPTLVWNYYNGGSVDYPRTSLDSVMLDQVMVLDALKVAWLRAKGFDSTGAEQDYESSLQEALDNDSAAQKLSLGRQGNGIPLLGEQSIPITGYGS